MEQGYRQSRGGDGDPMKLDGCYSPCGIVLQLRGDFNRNNFEIVDQFARNYGNIRRKFAFLRSQYTIDTVDTIDNTYTHVVIATAVVLDKLWKHGIRTESNNQPTFNGSSLTPLLP